LTPFIEAIAWERNDGTMDLFFNDFADDKEYQSLFSDNEHHYDAFMGVFICNRIWVGDVLKGYRGKAI
jgi:uncharacterized membrane protein